MFLIEKKDQSGFTILELMLVMVVTASIILYFSVHVKDQTVARQLERTSVEIQSLQQAVANYYLFNQDFFYSSLVRAQTKKTVGDLSVFYDTTADHYTFWPKSKADLLDNNFVINSGGGDSIQFCSSWPALSTSQGGSPCNNNPNLEAYTLGASDQDYFSIGLILPTLQLAQKLVAKLPGSTLDTSLPPGVNGILAYIPRPVAHYNPSLMTKPCSADNPNCADNPGEIVGARGWITSGGTISGYSGDPSSTGMFRNDSTDNRTIVMPNCPEGYEGHYIQSMMQVQTGNCIVSTQFQRGSTVAPQLMFWYMSILPTMNSASTSVTIGSAVGDYLIYAMPSIGGCWKFPLNPIGYINPGNSLGDSGFMVNQFLTMCVPNKHWFVKLPPDMLCNKTAFGITGVGNYSGRVSQCQRNWSREYNLGTYKNQCKVTRRDEC